MLPSSQPPPLTECRKCRAPLGESSDLDFCAACLLEPAVAWWHALPGSVEPELASPGDSIGGFVLGERLGEGTFGEVFIGAPPGGDRGKVAIKILKPGMDTREVLARFAAERETLARLDHPHIVRILDQGTTPQGRPWFAMELVDGAPLTAWCDQHRLPLAERLALFETVCRAVQHAHSRGLLHRDLKPENVLVTPGADGQPEPKLIDFGLAKAVEREWSGDTAFTLFHRAVGTPPYMAPEQTSPDLVEADSRTDVYALGVILYELLTGSPPLSSARLRAASWLETQRLIRDEVPPAPSSLLTARTDGSETIAARLGSSANRLRGQVRGELDWIVLRALEKEPGQRYATAAALADDVARFLAGEPVLARKPSTRQALRRLVRRHWLATAVVLVVAMVISTAAVVATVFAVRARRAEQLAVQRLNDALAARKAAQTAQESVRAASGFIVEMLQSPAPNKSGPTVTVAECLKDAEEKVGTRFAGKPEIQLQVLYAIEDTRRRLSLVPQGEPIPMRMVRITEQIEDPVRRSSWRNDAAFLLSQRGRIVEAAALYAETADHLQRDGKATVRPRIDALLGLARCLQTRDPLRSTALFEEGWRILSARDGASNARALGALAQEGHSLLLAELFGQAKETLRKAWSLAAEKGISPALEMAGTYLAQTLEQNGEVDAALKATTDTLARLEETQKNGYTRERMWLGDLHASYLGRTGQHEEEIAFCQGELTKVKKRFAPKGLEVLYGMERLIEALLRAGRNEEALRQARELAASREKTLGWRDAATVRSIAQVARALDGLHREGEAESTLREALARRLADPTDEVRYSDLLFDELASRLCRRGAFAEAERLYRDRLDRFSARLGRDEPRSLGVSIDLATTLVELGSMEEAEDILKRVCAGLPKSAAPNDPRLVNAWTRLVELYRKQGREAEAGEVVRGAIEQLTAVYGAGHPAIERMRRLMERETGGR